MSPQSNRPPLGWQPNVDPGQQMIPPPIGARVNVPPTQINNPPMSWTVSSLTDSQMIPPPIGSHPVNMLSGQGIQPPIGSEPVNTMGQGYPPPSGADLHPAACPPTAPGNYGLGGNQFSEQRQTVPPPVGSHPANLLAGCAISPPIGSHPVNMVASEGIQPPIGSHPVNMLASQGIQPPMGSSVNPPPSSSSGYPKPPSPTVSTFDEARFYAERGQNQIPPPIGSHPVNQLSGVAISPATTWFVPPPDQQRR